MMMTEGGQQLTGTKGGGDFDDPNGPDLPMWVFLSVSLKWKLIT
jgi:hypothetical protein